ncbi:TetR/AcrR family transcriptional regulator [Hamadaea tsunoensis]|uniref:TetR/AcrR family transcriptional regulator n=1 Tax=Hamadaea tsunoensis TaxID=53368 RepID=UPI0003FBF473|nr:TetR/AcrR family transcriptional regulator C-terminal domain-containing protein [Hamadaea tsunoensis]
MTEILWGGKQPPARGPKPALTLAAIATAGIAIADADGLGAVTMQRVAADLGYTKMSLYRYVPGKNELVALMVDLGMGGPPDLSALPGWRARLEAWSLALLPLFQAHPWTLEATVGVRAIGPNELGWMEAGVAALDGCGLSGAERMDAMVVLVGHVRQIAQQTAQLGSADGPENAFAQALGLVLREHADRFPAVAAALTDPAGADHRDQALDFGLRTILDGIGLLIERRQIIASQTQA